MRQNTENTVMFCALQVPHTHTNTKANTNWRIHFCQVYKAVR